MSRRKTSEEFISEARAIHGDKYDYSLVKYINCKTKVRITCKEHGIFEQQPTAHINGQGCRKCFDDRNRLPLYYFKDVCNEIHNNFYSYDKVMYKQLRDRIVIGCPIHGDFTQVAANHYTGSKCPKCIGKSSKGEYKIEELLKEHNLNYIKQKKFDECRYKQVLHFDFFIESLNLLIEYDGKQHYEPIRCFGGIDSLHEVQKRDSIKNEWVKSSPYKLLRIKYTDCIEDLLIPIIISS